MNAGIDDRDHPTADLIAKPDPTPDLQADTADADADADREDGTLAEDQLEYDELEVVAADGEDHAPLAEDQLAHTDLVDADDGHDGSSAAESALSNQDVIDEDLGLPRNLETVESYARSAAIDLDGVDVQIVDDQETIAYLDYMGAVARTDQQGVQLGPAAFQDEETLVRTLGHESVHVQQYREGRVTDSLTEPLEAEAYAAEEGFVDRWRTAT